MAGCIEWTPGDGQLAADGRPYYSTYKEFTAMRARVNGEWKYMLFKGKKMVDMYKTPAAVNAAVHELET